MAIRIIKTQTKALKEAIAKIAKLEEADRLRAQAERFHQAEAKEAAVQWTKY